MATTNEISVLKSMQHACRNIISVSNAFVNANDLTDKEIVFDNVYMNLVVISEANMKISDKTKAEFDIIRWDNIESYTAEIVSDYHAVDIGKIVAVCKYLVPSLITKLDKIISQLAD